MEIGYLGLQYEYFLKKTGFDSRSETIFFFPKKMRSARK